MSKTTDSFIVYNQDLHVELESILILKHAVLCMALTCVGAIDVYNDVQYVASNKERFL